MKIRFIIALCGFLLGFTLGCAFEYITDHADWSKKMPNEDLTPEQPIIPNGDIFKAIYPIGTVIVTKTPPETGEWKEIACCVWRRDK